MVHALGVMTPRGPPYDLSHQMRPAHASSASQPQLSSLRRVSDVSSLAKPYRTSNSPVSVVTHPQNLLTPRFCVKVALLLRYQVMRLCSEVCLLRWGSDAGVKSVCCEKNCGAAALRNELRRCSCCVRGCLATSCNLTSAHLLMRPSVI